MSDQSRLRASPPVLALVVVLAALDLCAAERVQHPFLLWTKEEAAAIRRRIETEPWAKKQFEATLKPQAEPSQRRTIDNLFLYLVMGDKNVVEYERDRLKHFIGCPPFVKDDMDWMWHRVDHYQHALRYDVLYDELNEYERRGLYETFRRMALYAVTAPHGRPGDYGGGERIRGLEGHPRMASHHVCALATGDPRLIEGLATTGGGFYSYIDSLGDGYFLGPSGSSGFNNLGHVMLWCRGCERLGLNQFGYGYKGKQGGSMRGLLESLILMGDARMEAPGGSPFYTRSPVKPVSFTHDQPALMREFSVRALLAPTVVGRFSDGTGGWKWWTQDAPGEGMNVKFETGEARMYLPLILELAHKKWPDAGFGYFLAQMRGPNDDKYYPSLYWNLDPIDPAQAMPPPQKSAVYPQHGIALLRAEEGLRYWGSPAPAAALRLATGSGIREVFSLTSFFAFNRPIYLVPALGRNRMIWSQCGLDVDGLRSAKAVTTDDRLEMGYELPHIVGEAPVRSSFDPLVKFVSARADQATRGTYRDASGRPFEISTKVFPGVDLERALFLTREYLFDVYRINAEQEHTYRWMVHALGKGQPERPDEWKETGDLSRVWPPSAPDRDERTWGIAGERSCAMEARDWSVTAVQLVNEAGARGRLGDAWYDRKVGARMTMLGEPGTTAYLAFPDQTDRPPGPPRTKEQPLVPARDKTYDSSDHGFTEVIETPPEQPKKDEPPPPPVAPPKAEPRKCDGWTTIVAARTCHDTAFVALHEPFEGGAPKLAQFRRIQQNDQGVAVAVLGQAGSPVNDRLLYRWGRAWDRPLTLSDQEESFTFADRAFIRAGADKVEAIGGIKGLKLKVTGAPKLVVNGQEQKAELKDGFLVWGE